METMLSAYGADPVMEGDCVKGVCVETKSGGVGGEAKIVIDATGEADVARRAGAPHRGPVPEVEEKGRPIGLGFYVGGVDWDRWEEAARKAEAAAHARTVGCTEKDKR